MKRISNGFQPFMLTPMGVSLRNSKFHTTNLCLRLKFRRLRKGMVTYIILKWKNRQLAKNKKPHICITASLLGILELGMPAVYLYNGELIRTSAVRSILEETPERVRFETQNSIYTISCDATPTDAVNAA